MCEACMACMRLASEMHWLEYVDKWLSTDDGCPLSRQRLSLMTLPSGVGGWVFEKFNPCVLKGHASPA